MTPKQIELVQSTWAMVVPIADTAANLFYDRLFSTAPEVRTMFPEDMAEQKKKLMATIGVAVGGLNDLGALVPVVQSLGVGHLDYGVREEHYKPVGAALLWTLGQGLGDKFTPEVKEAWTVVYTVLATTMIEAAKAKSAA